VFGKGFCLVNIDQVAAVTWDEGNSAVVSPAPSCAEGQRVGLNVHPPSTCG
jgi:hypothetical protein